MPNANMRQGFTVEDYVSVIFSFAKVNTKKNVFALNEEIYIVVCYAGEMIMRFQDLSL